MFGEHERLIFGPYWDGEKEIYADPIAVQRRLKHALGGEPNRLLEQCRSDIEEAAFEAMERILPAVVFAFGLKAFDPATGKGVAEDGVIDVLNAFTAWLEKKSARGESWPTAAPSSGPDFSEAGSPMTSSVNSTSTSNG